MHDLTLVGVHDDGEHLVLVGSDGQRYLLRVDEPLRAAVRRDRARLAQLQLEQTSTLRPRDIQAKIRSGRTADEVAEEAGVPVEHVRRYEGPVLAEREFVTRQARGVRLRRAAPGTPGSYPTLEELVSARLAAREVDPGSTSWDAWRTDGTWFVRLTLRGGRPPAAGRVGVRRPAPARDGTGRRGPLAGRRASAGSRARPARALPRRPRRRAAGPGPRARLRRRGGRRGTGGRGRPGGCRRRDRGPPGHPAGAARTPAVGTGRVRGPGRDGSARARGGPAAGPRGGARRAAGRPPGALTARGTRGP